MATTYTPDKANATEDAYAGRDMTDPYAYGTYDPKRLDAKYRGQEWDNEILALHAGRVASKGYRKTYTCVSGLAVGDPVYISANDTATKATAANTTTNKVIGFVRYKPTTTTCYIDHFVVKTSVSTGKTAGADVYLTDSGGYDSSAGTVATIVGKWLNATDVVLYASPAAVVGVTDGDKGDITVSSSGATWTIDNDVVSNAKAANMAESTIKGRAAGAGTGDPTDLTATQATAILNNVVGDSGAGGTKGLVPAPAAGDAAAGKFLKADGTWAVGGSYTDEQAQDAVGAMLDSTLEYDDATPYLRRAALTGDVTAAAGNNATTVANNAVTYAKMQDVTATSRIIGRKTAGSGDPEECTLSEILDFISSAAQGDILYRGAATWARLAAGTSGQVLQTKGSGANPQWSTNGGGGGATLAVLTALNNEPPAGSYATLDTRNAHPVLDFDDSADEAAVFRGVLLRGYQGGGITVRIIWMATSATTGTVRWAAFIERDDTGTDLDSSSFASAQTVGASTNATSGIPTYTDIAFTAGAQMDSLAAGEMFRVNITRDADGTTGTDNMAGDAELLAIEIRET